jgi:hypothetical protein
MSAMKSKKPTDWRKRFGAAKPPHIVLLHSDFAGVKAGMTMLISSPGDIAQYLARIPRGQTRSIERLRNEMARRAGAQSMCPVTTAIYLRVVAETALQDLADGQSPDQVCPFWRVILPGSKLAAKLSCGAEYLAHLQALDQLGDEWALQESQITPKGA